MVVRLWRAGSAEPSPDRCRKQAGSRVSSRHTAGPQRAAHRDLTAARRSARRNRFAPPNHPVSTEPNYLPLERQLVSRVAFKAMERTSRRDARARVVGVLAEAGAVSRADLARRAALA